MPECRAVLAVDVGTTSVKAGVVECSGLRVASTGSRPSPVEYPRRGWAVQDPERLWEAIAGASRDALEGWGRGVDALVFSTYLAGLVPLDSRGRELGSIITWLDERAHGLPRDLFSGFPRVSGYNLLRLATFLRITGGAPSKTGKDPISKMLWLREHEPETFREASVLGGLKTWVLARATGRMLTSPDEAHLTWLADTRGGRARWCGRLLRRYGIPPEKMPRIAEPNSIAGRLTGEAAESMGLPGGLPVVVGAGDVASVALGSGAVGEGEYHVYVGTSSWIGVHARRRLLDVSHYMGSLLSGVPGLYLFIAEQEIAGGFIDYLLRLLGKDYESLEEALEVPPGSGGILATPWLMGERAPIDDPHARATLIGLGSEHTWKHILRAGLEGVALNIAWSMKYAQRKAGRPSRVRAVGGGLRSRPLAVILASALGATLEVPEAPEHAGLRGAAALAVSALTGESPARITGRIDAGLRIAPDPEAQGVYMRMLEALERAYRGLRGVYRMLGEIGAGENAGENR